MVLEEQKHAAGCAAGPEIFSAIAGNEAYGIGGQGTRHDIGARGAVQVDLGERRVVATPARRGRPWRPSRSTKRSELTLGSSLGQ
jgi:hypothetical protein